MTALYRRNKFYNTLSVNNVALNNNIIFNIPEYTKDSTLDINKLKKTSFIFIY